MGRFNKATGEYDPVWEETVANQVRKMQDMTGREYFEIWCGEDDYLVVNPQIKLYDSTTKNDDLLFEKTGMRFDEFFQCVIPRSGAAYNLNPEFYEKRTGQPFPENIKDPAIIVICFSTQWFNQHYK